MRFSQSVNLDLGPTDLVRLAEQCVEGQRRQTERHAISVAAMEPTLIGLWDRARLRRVIDNLLSNALKYSPDGGKVVLEIGRERTAVGVWVVLDVRDEGVGIPAADLSIVVERFRRGTNIVGRTSGSGIGLAGAKQIVEQHGGTNHSGQRRGHRQHLYGQATTGRGHAVLTDGSRAFPLVFGIAQARRGFFCFRSVSRA